MNVQIMSTPCYLLETVELIYAFVNGVPAEELTGPGSYCIPVREVQRIMDTVCAGLALQNPTLQFFFQKEVLAHHLTGAFLSSLHRKIHLRLRLAG